MVELTAVMKELSYCKKFDVFLRHIDRWWTVDRHASAGKGISGKCCL